MSEPVGHGTVNVKLFGVLHAVQRDRGRPTRMAVEVPDEGLSAHDLAVRLELPLDRIEGVFCNHTVYALSHVIEPGDEVAFVPEGTPGPHRYFLGLYKAGREDEAE